MNDWHRTTIAPDGTYHLLDGQPLYDARFLKVQKFHEPGFAPARDRRGAFHINTRGEPVYAVRFRQTFWFYEGIAAVISTTRNYGDALSWSPGPDLASQGGSRVFHELQG